MCFCFQLYQTRLKLFLIFEISEFVCVPLAHSGQNGPHRAIGPIPDFYKISEFVRRTQALGPARPAWGCRLHPRIARSLRWAGQYPRFQLMQSARSNRKPLSAASLIIMQAWPRSYYNIFLFVRAPPGLALESCEARGVRGGSHVYDSRQGKPRNTRGVERR